MVHGALSIAGAAGRLVDSIYDTLDSLDFGARIVATMKTRFKPSIFLVFLALAAAPLAAQAAPECGVEAVGRTRREFQALYDAKKFADARALLNETWTACFIERPDGELAAWVASDLAVAAHRAGDIDECLQILSDFLPGFREANRRLASLPENLRKALTFNAQSCEKACKGTGPGCLTARAARAHGRLDPADFVPAQSCDFEAGEGALAIGRDVCLRMLEPKKEVDPGDREKARTTDICPRVSLVRKGATAREQSLPANSWLRHADLCCAEISVGVDPRGRIRIAPSDNPPEGCLHGRRSIVAEDIYLLEGGALKLDKRQQIGVR